MNQLKYDPQAQQLNHKQIPQIQINDDWMYQMNWDQDYFPQINTDNQSKQQINLQLYQKQFGEHNQILNFVNQYQPTLNLQVNYNLHDQTTVKIQDRPYEQVQIENQLTNKIQQILDNRSRQTSLVSTYADRDQNSQQRKKRVSITRQMLQQLKIIFEQYTININKPEQRTTFRDISVKLNISIAQVKLLYNQYLQDASFSSRLNKLREQMDNSMSRISKNNVLTEKRLRFISQLIKRYENISQQEIVQEMEKVDHLHQYDRQGYKIPITKKMIRYLIKLGSLSNKKVLNIYKNNNDAIAIENRFKYCQRYLTITDDQNSQICFLGEFNFSSSPGQANFGGINRDGHRGREGRSYGGQDKYGKNIQCLIVIGLSGVIYYEIFDNIYKELNFQKTVMNVGRIIGNRNSHLKKYLIVQTNPFHKRQDLKKMQIACGVKVLFTPSGNPMLNPTQYVFNEVKQLVKAKAYKCKRTYRSVLVQIIDGYKERSLNSYFSFIKPYLELALKRQPYK